MALIKASLLVAALFSQAQASYLQNELSFGHLTTISPNRRAVPNYHLMGNPDPPQILSNKLVLTPPAPGNVRGAVWGEKPVLHSVWTADLDFRATGPERGGGNLNIWYTTKGQADIGTASIYTVGRFDGLALVVDQYAGSGGFIRGFLNDGSTEYKSHHSVDSLAFGHCEYSYRNLGRPSRIAISQTADKFSVSVDGRLCFDSTKIKLPIHNYFGISAASAENPDSFEVFKFVVTTESHTADVDGGSIGQPQFVGGSSGAQAPLGQAQSPPENKGAPGDIPAFSDPPEAPASNYKSSDAQFADLHNRLQAMMKHVSALNRDINGYTSSSLASSSSISETLSKINSRFDALEKKLDTVQADVRQTKADLHNSLDKHVAGLKHEVRENHGEVFGELDKKSSIGLWGVAAVIFGTQGVLMVCYILYKRRVKNGPKKYL